MPYVAKAMLDDYIARSHQPDTPQKVSVKIQAHRQGDEFPNISYADSPNDMSSIRSAVHMDVLQAALCYEDVVFSINDGDEGATLSCKRNGAITAPETASPSLSNACDGSRSIW